MRTRIILIHNHYDEAHLHEVMAEMRVLGPPTIRAIWDEAYGAWVALEGCHRIRAAAELGYVPEIEEVDYDGEAMWSSIVDLDHGLGECDDCTIADIVDSAYSRKNIVFDND